MELSPILDPGNSKQTLLPGLQPSPDEVPSPHAQFEEAEARVEQAVVRVEQAEVRVEQAEVRTEQAEVRTEEAEARTEQAVIRIEQAELRTGQAEVRTEEAEARTQQAMMRVEQAEVRTGQAEVRTVEAEARTEQAEVRTVEAKARTEQAEARTALAETRIEQAETRSEHAKTRTEHAKARTERAEMRTEHAETRSEEAETRSEQAVRDSEVSYRRLFETAKDGILILDIDTGRISDVNPFLTDLLGFSRSEMVGKTIGELSPFKDMEDTKAMLERLQTKGFTRYEDLALQARDSRKIAVEFVGNVYEDGGKKVIQCNIRDITQRKEAEVASRWLAAIVASSDDAIIGEDLWGVVTSWNAGAEKEFGYTASDMIGHPITRLVPPDRHGEEVKILDLIARGKSVRHFETMRLRKDGSTFNVSVTVSAIRDSAGKIIGASKVVRDITTRKKAEETIHRLNAELEQRVLQRTAELEAANKELESFSYSVSHDLRAPLRAIDGFSQAVQEDFSAQLPEEGQRYLKTIREGAQRMGVLIDDLLTFSRLSRLPLTRGTVNTNALVRELVADLSAMAENGHAKIEMSDLPQSNADPALLRQVWTNLLSNALKYTRHRKGANIKIAAAETDGATTWFVQDNGTGFDMLYVDKLFGVFQRLHSAEEYEGTGVGLAIVQRIVERHGGRVWADAALDRGATFSFTLGQNVEE
jgi:PAS domain S-box-containing protein